MFLPGVLSINDQVGVKHAKALDHLAGPKGVVDDDELGDECVQENGLYILSIVILMRIFVTL